MNGQHSDKSKLASELNGFRFLFKQQSHPTTDYQHRLNLRLSIHCSWLLSVLTNTSRGSQRPSRLKATYDIVFPAGLPKKADHAARDGTWLKILLAI